MLSIRVLSCAALLLLRYGNCAPRQVPETHGLDGQRHVTATDSHRTGAKANHMMDAINTGDNLGMRNADDASSKDASFDTGESCQTPGNMRTEELPGHDLTVNNFFAALLETGCNNSGLNKPAHSLFGVCMNSDNSPWTVVTELRSALKTSKGSEMNIVQLNIELLGTEGERLILTLDIPQSPLRRLKPTLLLAFGSPLTAKDLHIAFTSQDLHPNVQNVCISEETKYIILTGKASEQHHRQKWHIILETESLDAGQKLQEILLGGGQENNVSMSPLLLFWSEGPPDTRFKRSSMGSPETFCFLCELQNLLEDLPPVKISPQIHPEPTSVQRDSWQSLPPLTLGLSSSETLLVALMKSSSPTLFSFPTHSSVLRLHHGELAMPPGLVEALGQQLEQVVEQMMRLIREEMDLGAIQRLERLKASSEFPKEDPPAGESLYRAFLLLKALQTVTHAYEARRGLRATRGGQASQVGANHCRLQSLSVPFEPHYFEPSTVDIKDCQGECRFPQPTGSNHAALRHSLGYSLCCVPVAYEAQHMVDFKEGSTHLFTQPTMVAKECECR